MLLLGQNGQQEQANNVQIIEAQQKQNEMLIDLNNPVEEQADLVEVFINLVH
jgi:hypothetical protein